MKTRIVRSVSLVYAAGADKLTDRPAHVRAGSGLAWVGNRLAVIQDDANFVALIDAKNGKCDVVMLPAGYAGMRQFDDARGNKRYKQDFESLVALPNGAKTQLIAFGSGSSPARENILVMPDADATPSAVRVVPAPRLYAKLRAGAEFAGSELNVEGAAQVGEHIRLFGRGNGAPRGDLQPTNATCDINCISLLAHLENPASAPPPAPENVVQYSLGEIDGVALSFTDAVAFGDGVLYVAAAEDSPDAVQDGAVAGSALGVISADGSNVRWTHLTLADGERARMKVEGVAIGQRAGQLFVVVDRDEHHTPSELLEIEVSGFGLG